MLRTIHGSPAEADSVATFSGSVVWCMADQFPVPDPDRQLNAQFTRRGDCIPESRPRLNAQDGQAGTDAAS
jgi:hypothetical protein